MSLLLLFKSSAATGSGARSMFHFWMGGVSLVPAAGTVVGPLIGNGHLMSGGILIGGRLQQ